MEKKKRKSKEQMLQQLGWTVTNKDNQLMFDLIISPAMDAWAAQEKEVPVDFNTKEYFGDAQYDFDLEDWDESGYLGINEENAVAMLNDHASKVLELFLHDVMQQRELLVKFHSWYNDEYATSALDSDRIVDKYIKTNSA